MCLYLQVYRQADLSIFPPLYTDRKETQAVQPIPAPKPNILHPSKMNQVPARIVNTPVATRQPTISPTSRVPPRAVQQPYVTPHASVAPTGRFGLLPHNAPLQTDFTSNQQVSGVHSATPSKPAISAPRTS